jgi:hypothetical protein
MKVEFSNNPWKHAEVKNFFNDDDFKLVNNFSKTVEKPNERGKRKSYVIENDTTDKYEKYIREICWNPYRNLLEKVGFELKSHHFLDLQFDCISPDFFYKIHTDLEEKLFSFVLYLSDQGKGTHLYSSNEDEIPAKSIEWQKNCGIGFQRTNNTHHNFDTLGNSYYRRSLLMTIFDENIENV